MAKGLYRTSSIRLNDEDNIGLLSPEAVHKKDEFLFPNEHVSIVVVGATGDLAWRKILPALFSLYLEKRFPKNFQLVGFARSHVDLKAFRDKIAQKLACRAKVFNDDTCGIEKSRFLQKLQYVSGRYDSDESFAKLDTFLLEAENKFPKLVHHRLYYFAIPPDVFLVTARSISDQAKAKTGWTRIIVEKPFGKDRASSDALSEGLASLFEEQAIYRIDHYLGKEVVQNLMVLRFANLIFEPIWNRDTVESVSIAFKEDLGVEGRGGYFDEYGIVRDVMQNHLLQILALVAMEPPVQLNAEDIRDEKVKALRCVKPLSLEDLVLGQYTAGAGKVGYVEDPTVAKDSRTPTYAAAVLNIHNRRWDGVPFLLHCGKGLNGRLADIRVKFKAVPGSMFAADLPKNELIIQVQPNEGIHLRTVMKVPGLQSNFVSKDLDLNYKASFASTDIPDAYERLILDVFHGDKSLFIRSDELVAAWNVFTPVLHEIENKKVKPIPYPFGSDGPTEALAKLAAKHNVNLD